MNLHWLFLLILAIAMQGHSTPSRGDDSTGCFDYRSDVGSYTYGEGNAGPQAVTRIQAAPGVFPAVDQVVQTYTSFDKIQELTEGSLSLKVLYDDAGQKLLQALTNNQTQETTTTLYQGFSEKVTTGSMVKTMDYIASPEGVVAIFTRNGNTDSTLHFLVKDYAGSIIGILNPDGTYAQELSYDAWGRRRNPTTWQPYIGTMPQALYTRGYTMHEHLANFGLIDMKGRVGVYPERCNRFGNPLVGHFLSSDPFIQAPEFSLSFNRYSYCLNNPLLYTDPTGFFAEGPDVDASGLSNNFDGSNDLGSANSGAETRCNTDRQTDPNWNDDGYIATWDGTKYVYEYLNDVGNLVGKDLYRYQGGLLDGSTAVYDQKTGECVDVLPPSQTSEIDPLTGRENLMPLVDANWIIDLATGLAGGIRAATSRTIARETVTVVDGVAAKTSSRAFFSGAGTEARALNEGFTTLSQTRAGQNLMKMTEGMPYYPGSQAYNWWARLSSTYAKGIPKGSNVNVFLNNPSPSGIWNAVEKPILQQRGINIIIR